ncbi:MAG: hypothetical protein VCC00_06265 [Deltaproteobacteria bacterium]
MATALEFRPLVRRAFTRGELTWGRVRLLARANTTACEEEWVVFAKAHTVDELGNQLRTGSRPSRGLGEMAARARVGAAP